MKKLSIFTLLCTLIIGVFMTSTPTDASEVYTHTFHVKSSIGAINPTGDDFTLITLLNDTEYFEAPAIDGVATINNIPAGEYEILVSTYTPNALDSYPTDVFNAWLYTTGDDESTGEYHAQVGTTTITIGPDTKTESIIEPMHLFFNDWGVDMRIEVVDTAGTRIEHNGIVQIDGYTSTITDGLGRTGIPALAQTYSLNIANMLSMDGYTISDIEVNVNPYGTITRENIIHESHFYKWFTTDENRYQLTLGAIPDSSYQRASVNIQLVVEASTDEWLTDTNIQFVDPDGNAITNLDKITIDGIEYDTTDIMKNISSGTYTFESVTSSSSTNPFEIKNIAIDTPYASVDGNQIKFDPIPESMQGNITPTITITVLEIIEEKPPVVPEEETPTTPDTEVPDENVTPDVPDTDTPIVPDEDTIPDTENVVPEIETPTSNTMDPESSVPQTGDNTTTKMFSILFQGSIAFILCIGGMKRIKVHPSKK